MTIMRRMQAPPSMAFDPADGDVRLMRTSDRYVDLVVRMEPVPPSLSPVDCHTEVAWTHKNT